jgi:ectoine hydroxylase-related dioxygenase (phytanoyl-CoA dioxygenase family)
MSLDLKHLSAARLDQFHRDGYLICRGLFDAEEIELLGRAAKEDRVLDQNSFGRADGNGGNIRLSLWSDPGDNVYGMFARSRRIVGAMEQILGGPVGHYHSKMIMKDAKVGGAWEWHQDYGYWYDIGYLFPDLTSVMIAVDKATKENGCLQVIKGSHRLGRINHTATGQQAGADLARVAKVIEKLELAYCEMDPGDAVFFHSNTLHRSDQNQSDKPRWAMVCCYSLIGNDSAQDPLHPTPLERVSQVPDSAIREAGMRRFAAADEDNTFLNPNKHLGEEAVSR